MSAAYPITIKLPDPPKHLSAEAKRWWSRILAAWPLEDASLLILESALECLDRMRQAQATIRAEGSTVKDRWGVPRAHPAVGIEAEAKASMLKHFKALAIDLEPLRDGPGRPPSSKA